MTMTDESPLRALIDQHTRAFDVGDADSLVEAGMNSLAVMRLSNLLRRAGARQATFAKLMGSPTREAWLTLVETASEAAPEASGPAGRPQAGRADAEPFALTDTQMSYFVGRQDGMALGGNGCHAYIETKGGDVDADRLQKAWSMLFQAHSMLRARFTEDGKQYVADRPSELSSKLAVYDFSALAADVACMRMKDARRALSQRRLDVSQGQTCGLALVKLPGNETRVCFDIDLLVCDVQSFQSLLADLAQAYADGSAPAADPDWDFATYLELKAKREGADRKVRDEDERYWSQRLADFPLGPDLPKMASPDVLTHPRYDNFVAMIEPRVYESLKARAARHGKTVAMTLIAAFAETTAAWSDDRRFLLNLPVFSRDTSVEGIEHAVSDFSDILLLEADCRASETFSERLDRIGGRFLEDMAHRSVNGVQLARRIAAAGGPSVGLAPVVFACNLGEQLLSPTYEEYLGELEFMTSQTPQVQIDCQAFDHRRGLRLSWDAVSGLYPEGMVRTMFETFVELVRRLAISDKAWEEPVVILPEGARRALEEEWEGVLSVEPERAALHAAFCERAGADPDAIALVDAESGRSMTYSQVLARSGALARLIVDAGAMPGDLVALCLPRGFDQVCAMLGVEMAGCAYVPVDPAQPQARKKLMAEKLGCALVLADEAHAEEASALGTVVAVERATRSNDAHEALVFATSRMPDPDATAYIIMTSGSTGVPKGVEISHAAAWNTVSDVSSRLGVGPGDRLLAVSSYDFDLSVYDVFGILGAGATLVCMPDDARRDSACMLGYVERHDVNLWNTVPMILDMLVTQAENDGASLGLRAVMLSGDWIGMDLPERLARLAENCRFISMGGATEAAIWSNWQEVDLPLPESWSSIPYGGPLRAQAYRVVDCCGNDRPAWAIGELLIGGAGVAKGYRGDDELTRRQFFDERGVRWYRTGDIGRLWDDGTIEFLGRRDFQVKVKGHRIELGEVEAAATSFSAVDACAACVALPQRRLVAFVKASEGHVVDFDLLSAHMASLVPSYMVPSTFEQLERLPMSGNGKIDRKALARMACDMVARESDPVCDLRTPTEQAVASIWEKALGTPVAQRNASYYELGGNSLTATRVIGAVRERLGVGLSTADVFTHATVEDLARLIDERASSGPEESSLPAMEVRARPGDESPFALTALQRAYLVGRHEGIVLGGQSTRAYIEVAVRDLDMGRLSAALNELVKTQDSLRLSVDAERAVQRATSAVPPVVIPLIDVSHLDERAWSSFMESRRAELFAREFDVEKPFLWAMEVTRWNDEWHIHFCHDGMIMDGWSSERLFEQLESFYFGVEPAATPSYRDYVAWLDDVERSEAYRIDRAYWMRKAREFPESQALETVQAPEAVEHPRNAHAVRAVSQNRWDRLKQAAAGMGMTPFAAMLSAFGKALERYGGCHDFLINTPMSFRPASAPGIDGLVGECSDYRLFRFTTQEGETMAQTARNVFAQLAEEGRHLAFRGTDLARALQQEGDATASAAAPVVFTSTAEVGLRPSRWYRKVTSRTHTSQVWMDAVVMPAEDGVMLSIDYVEDLFADGVVDGIADAFVRALDLLVDEPGSWERIRTLPLSANDAGIIDEINETARSVAARTYAPALRKAFERFADAEAVTDGETSLTYAELERLVGRAGEAIEAFVRERDGAERAPIGIMMGKGAMQVAAALACTTRGRAFMPVDVEYPPQAIASCHEGAGLAGIIVDAQTRSLAPDGVPVLELEAALPDDAAIDWVDSDADDVLAIINTSGSTGTPKGIRLTNEGVMNCIEWSAQEFGIDRSTRVLAVTNFAHDMGLYDVLGPILSGAALVVLGEQTRREPRAWARLLDECKVTFWNSVPALMSILLEAGGDIGEQARASLSCVVQGGDWLSPRLAARILETFPNARLYNVGGPTETTIWNIFHRVCPEDMDAGQIPYGRPIWNTRYLVLDDRMDLCPVGVPGLMHVAGPGVCVGYTGSAQGSEPFAEWQGERICCTGDRGMYLTSGELRILGRADLQVKVKGKRIEVGGIERLINQVEGVGASAVVVNEGTGWLVAYVTGEAGEDRIRRSLEGWLPTYMVPSRIVPLDSMPLTRNGKPDRAFLAAQEIPSHAAPEAPQDAAPSVADDDPREAVIGELVAFCRETLGDDGIGPDDNYFAVGGDSLAAMRIGAWVFDRFGTELSVVQIMAQPTIREWAEILCA